MQTRHIMVGTTARIQNTASTASPLMISTLGMFLAAITWQHPAKHVPVRVTEHMLEAQDAKATAFGVGLKAQAI